MTIYIYMSNTSETDVYAVDKLIDVTPHSKTRPAHTEFLGFLSRLGSGPAIVRDTINRR